MPTLVQGENIHGFSPAPGTKTPQLSPDGYSSLQLDTRGNLSIRGPITTDEGSVREDFTGTTIYQSFTGTVTFTNGSSIVNGTGTTFMDGTIAYGDYIKLSSHADTVYAKVQSVDGDGRIVLASAYTGATGTGTAYVTKFKPIIGSGGTISVGSGVCTIASGTTTASKVEVTREIDYCPLMMVATASVSQRIANQTGYIGLVDDATNPGVRAWFVIDGTVNTTIKTETAFSTNANDTETNTVTLPSGNTSTAHRYKIELTLEYCNFYIDDTLVAQHKTHLPNPYAVMDGVVGWVNGTSPATTSSIVLDTFFVSNYDTVQVLTNLSPNNPSWQYGSSTAITNTSDVALKAAGATGIRNYVTGLQFVNTGATATVVVVKDGSTVIWSGNAQQNVPVTVNFTTPLKGTAATAMNFACLTTASNTIVSAQGYQAP